MALPEKILYRKFNRTFRNRPINMARADDNMVWKGITVSSRTDDNADFTAEQEAVLDLSKRKRRITIEFLDVPTLIGRHIVIPLHPIEETASPTPDTYMLKLKGGEELKFRFGSPAAKSTFVEAITIYSSDSGNSSEGSNDLL